MPPRPNPPQLQEQAHGSEVVGATIACFPDRYGALPVNMPHRVITL
jgi:hypothetical protein